jgi:hypothetical protein
VHMNFKNGSDLRLALALAVGMLGSAGAPGPSAASPLAGAQGKPQGTASAAVDLRPNFKRWQLPLKKQEARNTCSVCTMTAAFEYALSKKLDRGIPLSAEYLNWACNQVIGNKTEDRGQFFSDLGKGFEHFGICVEAAMPYAPRFDPGYSPSQQAFGSAREVMRQGLRIHWTKPNDGKIGITPAHLEQIKATLRAGWPVCAGSAHSVLVVGYRDDPVQPGGGVFFTRDSGTGKEAMLNYADAKAKLCDLLWIDAPVGGR